MAPKHTAACVLYSVVFASLLVYSHPRLITVINNCVHGNRYSHSSLSCPDSVRFDGVRALDLSCVVPTVCLPVIRPIVTVTNCRRRKFANSRTVYYNNSDASFNVQLNTLLLLSGDVHANPGPFTTNTSTSTR